VKAAKIHQPKGRLAAAALGDARHDDGHPLAIQPAQPPTLVEIGVDKTTLSCSLALMSTIQDSGFLTGPRR